jgi:hypothetical protein
MSCKHSYLESNPCAKSIGGIKRMWYTFKDNIAIVMDYDDAPIGEKYFDPRYIATLILEGGQFMEVVSKPDAVTITENITVDETVGSDTTTTEITIKQSDMISDAIDRLKASAFVEYVFLFEDMQGRYFLYGIDKPVTLSSATVESGNVIGDFNGGTFTFTTEGVLSRLWTKYEAENGDYTSNYVKVKELFQESKLTKLGNFNTLTFDTGYDFDVVDITKTASKISIDLNFEDNRFQLLHRDLFQLEMPNGNTKSLATFDNDDMYSIVLYYYRKGLILTDKRKFKVVLDTRISDELITALMLNLDTGVSTEQINSIESIPSTYLLIIEGEVIFKREAQNEEDTVVINSIKYMPSDWK